jgi:hypothetical protein
MKAQTDIRTTSYDEVYARPYGYQGTIDDVIHQMQGEHSLGQPELHGRAELLHFLGVDKIASNGPSVELDQGVWYGDAS